MWHTILFDLDGTLTDPKEGITTAFAYALEKYGIEADTDSLTSVIGPPLKDSFMDLYGFDEPQAVEAIREYRVYFADRGWAENVPYPGISALLRRLQREDLMLLRYRVAPDGEVHKKERSVLLIKRAAAMPGDEIDAAGGTLIVNQEQAVGDLVSSDLVYPVTVPTGYVFALGDNRTLSVDSRQRAFGMVPEADVLGRPVAVVWPVYAMGLVK